ncbi:MAG: hypothetical protein BWY43_00163 [candidate division WS2 bacterium ADurb.Bin280]|uniref:Uncharacterized protein n=1 Tax=candidate division WS2 bacterium ADurb.Bin280 TaxID=1852829 RepID=A0A1V5SGJ7_9BACT|nr:MAG: hypothetical protein BWY43_00163 [candidate division WS2 bacterium ADurb.Bin280]
MRVFRGVQVICVIKKIPEIIIAVIDMGGVAIKRGRRLISKGPAMLAIPVIKAKALTDLIIGEPLALRSFVIVSELPSTIFHLLCETGVGAVASARVRASKTHRRV